jgi:hypothetical protein
LTKVKEQLNLWYDENILGVDITRRDRPDISRMSPITRAIAEWYWYSPNRNPNLPGRGFEVYVRKYIRHSYDGAGVAKFSALDLAQIEFKQTGKGQFTRMITELRELKLCQLLFLENVCATSDFWRNRLWNYLERTGWSEYKSGIDRGLPPLSKTFYLCLMDTIPDALLKDPRYLHNEQMTLVRESSLQ